MIVPPPGVEGPSVAPDRRALEALIVDNPDLERLESLLEQFNMFEAIGVVRHELRHSDFLAFLLDPGEKHGLGDAFLKRLLQKALTAVADQPVPISLIDLDVWNLDATAIRREWQRIDLLLQNEPNRFLVVIENKIDSLEHDAQLQSYREMVTQHYPGWKILFLFLTPDGTQASDEYYISVSYELICELVERLTISRASTLGADILIVMQHYAQMLRRHIVSDSEIAELCERIYSKHRQALDLIYEHRPDRQLRIRNLLVDLIEKEPTLLLDHATKGNIRYLPRRWDESPFLAKKLAQGWTPSGRILLFEFVNQPSRLLLRLYVGPGIEEQRRLLINMARSAPPPFKLSNKASTPKWTTLYQREILSSNDYEESNLSVLEEKISAAWLGIINNDRLTINQFLDNQQWLWTPTAAS